VKFSFIILLTALACSGLFWQSSCKKKNNGGNTSDDVWDIATQGIPRFAGQYIDLSKIQKISRYRSSAGHDYSDFTEHCRSMKHYFYPKDSVNWTQVQVKSPVAGSITRYEQEWAGVKFEIQSSEHPAFRFVIFHTNPQKAFQIGEFVQKGQILGTHFGFETWSDIAVIVNDPTKQGRMVSYFETLADEVFAEYQNRGVNVREDLIISKALRDLNPLECNAGAFLPGDPLDVWVQLQ